LFLDQRDARIILIAHIEQTKQFKPIYHPREEEEEEEEEEEKICWK